MTEGCNETFDLEYLKFLRWIWTYPTAKAPTVLEKLKALKTNKNIFILCSLLEVDEFLQTLRKSNGAQATW